MNKNIKRNITFNTSLIHKLFACVVSSFILISSMNIGYFKENVSLLESAKVSADTILVQFFYISSLPANMISRFFTDTEIVSKTVKEPMKKQQKDSSKKEENSSKASFGFSIVSSNLNLQINKVKNKVLTIINNLKIAVSKYNYQSLDINLSFDNLSMFNIMILLLAILLARRNIGDNSIITNIKNNRLAQLVFSSWAVFAFNRAKTRSI